VLLQKLRWYRMGGEVVGSTVARHHGQSSARKAIDWIEDT
jgi:hypothetical protein